MLLPCAKLEAELAELDHDDRLEMLSDVGLREPALAVLARASYTTLGLQSFFTAGEKEVRAWTVPIGATAPQAAGVIHTDFEKGFIRAEIHTVEDLESLGSEKEIRAAGKLRIEGKEYVMQDGDSAIFSAIVNQPSCACCINCVQFNICSYTDCKARLLLERLHYK